MAKTKKINKKNLMDAGKKPLLILGGLFVGSFAGKMLDKALKVDELPEGFNVKKLIRPLVLMGAGVAGNIMLKNEDLKMAMTGVTASGFATGVKVFLKKDILNGLSGVGESDNHVTQLTIEPYNPELKELEGVDTYFLPEFHPQSVNGDTEDVDYIEINSDLV